MNRTQIGDRSENYACEYLIRNGYQILSRNWRYGKAEIDIIARHQDTLVFIEVKSRSSLYYGEPETAVTELKEKFIFDAAQRYMETNNYDWEIRFDIISILLDKGKRLMLLKHILDVFF